LADCSVNCIVTSPPYFGLRDYGHEGQIGLEPTPDEYVAEMVEVLRAARRVLHDDGTLWLNLGDSYATQGGSGRQGQTGQRATRRFTAEIASGKGVPDGLKPKDLIGIPWRVALALQADGWYLRQDIIWHKPNPMPESVTDRCTKAHEYISCCQNQSGIISTLWPSPSQWHHLRSQDCSKTSPITMDPIACREKRTGP
jgi:DNA modification methylase